MKKKFDIYNEVTKRIINKLEQGIIPWLKPWVGTVEGAFNRITKKPYSVLNQCLLQHTGEYATMKQWNGLGGKVRKGEHPEMVVFWKIYRKEVEEDGEKVVKTIPLLRYINVYHISQIEGVKPLDAKLPNCAESIPEADEVIKNYTEREGITIHSVKGNRAFYSPKNDFVQLPIKAQFENANEYYSTAFHELVHSTGHESRLNRISKVALFGDEEYSKEELVAEIGSAGLMNRLGLETSRTIDNSAAYIQSWIKALKNDTRMIVSASSKANKAMNLILDINEENEE